MKRHILISIIFAVLSLAGAFGQDFGGFATGGVLPPDGSTDTAPPFYVDTALNHFYVYDGAWFQVIGLGTSLSSSTNDILSSTGSILFGGTGGVNNESLLWDYETTANEVGLSSPTGVSLIDAGLIDLSIGDLTTTSITMPEKAAAAASVAGFGEVWIKNDAPNTVWFTDDAGTDWQLGGVATSMNWADPVDAVITPDADGTRDFGLTGTRFATGYFDNLDVTSQVLSGSVVTASLTSQSTSAASATIAADSDNNELAMTADLLFDNNGGTTVGRIRWDEASTTFNLGYGAANHLSIFGATGKVGLGNQTPGAPLTVGPGTGTGDISNNPGGLSDDYALVSSGTALETTSWNLSVNEGSRISTSKFFLTDAVSGSGAWGHWLSWASGGSQPYVIGSAGSEWLRIDTAGQLGVGTNSPGHELDVQDAGATVIRSKSTAASAYTYVDSFTGFDSGHQFYENSVLLHQIFQDSSRDNDLRLFDQVNAYDILYYDRSTLNVGIGTSVPNTELTIGDGTSSTERLRLDALTNPIIYMENASNEWRMWGSSTNFYLEPETVNASFFFRDQANTTVANWQSSTGSLRLGSGGAPTDALNIGDGTDATESLRIDALTSAELHLENASNDWRFVNSGTHLQLRPDTINASFYLVAQPNGNVARWSTSDGSLRLGDGTNPTYRLDAYNSAGGDVLRASAGASTSDPIAVIEGTSNITGAQPVALQLKDNQNSAAWTADALWTALDFYSSDTSGAGAAVKGRVGMTMAGASGASTEMGFWTGEGATGLTKAMSLTFDNKLELPGLATEAVAIIDAGSTAATEQDWIEVTVGGVTGYIRVFATK